MWPLSNDIRSKQFIKFFKREDGTYESMVQRVYRQITEVDPDAVVTVATAKNQVSALHNQLGESIGISVEPCRRDTFPAIVLAAAYLRDVQGVSEDESIVVCPVDPYVNNDYFQCLKTLSQQADKGEANLCLMGITPTYPSEKYGYIIPTSAGAVSTVSAFKEKPTVDVAADYIARGALWNGGIFAFKLGFVLNVAQNILGSSQYQELFDQYDTLPKISFDYAVVEHEKNIQVVRFNGDWKDVGTWNTLTETMSEQTVGNAIVSESCQNVHVINELSVPVFAMGLKNVVISASHEGILVSDKEQSSYIKPYVDKIDQQVMYAEKSWGYYHVLDMGRESMTIKVVLLPGHRMNYHAHHFRDETWTVIDGTGTVVIDGEEKAVSAGDFITLPRGCKHTVIANTEITLIEVQTGENISVHDKIKFEN